MAMYIKKANTKLTNKWNNYNTCQINTMENIRINKVQKAAFELIQSDARFLNTIIDINTNAKNIDSNF